MNTSDGDRDLRAAFEALRDEDRSGAPPFDGLLVARPPRRASGARWILATAAAAGAVGALLLRTPAPNGGTSLEDALAMAEEISTWSAPSDTFTELSGAGILEGIPDLEMHSLPLPEPTEETP